MAIVFRWLMLALSLISALNYGIVSGGDNFPTLGPSASPAPSTEPSTSPSQIPSRAPSTVPSPSSILSTDDSSTVSFYIVGDVPYSDMEACLLPFELEKLDLSALFLLHLGDIRDGKPDLVTGKPSYCPKSVFQDIYDIFESSPLTTFFIPGENAWQDCANPEEAYEYWEEYLFNYNERTDLSWPAFPSQVNRWNSFPAGVFHESRRPELFSFLIDSVLFVGLSLPDPGRNKDHEWYPRDGLIRDNIQWTRENLNVYNGQMEAVVLFGHSSYKSDDYFEDLAELVTEPDFQELPFLFVEDNHFFNTERGFLDVPNLLQIEQDDTVTPLKITVNASAKGLLNVFQYDERCKCSSSHRPTRLYTYDSLDPCSGACSEGLSTCQGKDRCSPKGNPKCS